ncbi:MAG: YIP1 family protein [Ignavibacteriaceae bacterium]
MTFGKFVICKKCNSPNQLSKLNCIKCSSILRERVVNLDFSVVFTSLIENPSKGFYKIILAEHKNYISLFFFFFLLKMFLFQLSLSSFLGKELDSTINVLIIFTLIVVLTTVILTAFLEYIFKLFGIRIKFKDYFALLIFASFPFIFSSILLTLLELAVFGGYLFSIYPSPFEIKPFLAYLFLVLEIIILIWTLVLFVISINTLTDKIFAAIIIGIINFMVLVILPHIISLNISL